MKPLITLTALSVLSSVLLLSSPAFADVQAVIEHSRGTSVEVSYRDEGHVKVGNPEEALYYLTSDGKPYVVMAAANGDKRFAMNMQEFLSRSSSGNGVEVPGKVDMNGVHATPLDRTEDIGGITGKVYRVEDFGHSWELVVTDDATVAGVTRAIYSAEIRMAHMASQPMGAEPLAKELKLAESLGSPGILRGQLYTLKSLQPAEAQADDNYQLAKEILVVRDWQEMMDSYH
ncbi:hypothetical protein [uncultured Marinobacter sp.]|uniref:hypothetical protein n=1 Tax=uncultured Marinobacter sp. TaxID=187379 RepID=UPI0030DD536C